MFSQLEQFSTRPAAFSVYTADQLWTDPHTASQMLKYHLDGTVNASSRTTDFIERSVAWLREAVGIGVGTRVLDLGCGPGLNSNPLAAIGASVTGVDFSERSIQYARDTAPSGVGDATYIHGDYLDVPIPGTFDVALMIMCDYCALSPQQRAVLLGRLMTLLASGGRFIFDVYGLPGLAAHEEAAAYTRAADGGFWSPAPYFEFQNTFVYQTERVTLDKYEIIEADRHRTIYNWLQHFDTGTLEAELERGGFELTTVVGDLTGAPFDPNGTEFAAIATLRAAGD